MPNAPEVASTSSGEPSARLDVRVVLAAVSLALLVFPFGLTLLLVKDRWAPLLRLDRGARDSLHRYAVARPGFVAAMQLISNSGSGAVWAVVLTLSVGWLLWRRLPRLALFVVITAAGSSLLNHGQNGRPSTAAGSGRPGRPRTWAELPECSRPGRGGRV